MIRLLAILLIIFFAVTFLAAVVRKVLRPSGPESAGNKKDKDPGKKNGGRIVDAKYEEIN
ncbi:MAG: hypothetical protein K1X85_12530 [Ignavibacteria bacterium]|nr:hypothetical protein [Ignavibacteria bacterium]